MDYTHGGRVKKNQFNQGIDKTLGGYINLMVKGKGMEGGGDDISRAKCHKFQTNTGSPVLVFCGCLPLTRRKWGET